MKEATGELNVTVITIAAIAAVAALFYAFIWPIIKNNISNSSKCAAAYNCTSCNSKTCKCKYTDENNRTREVTCPVNTR